MKKLFVFSLLILVLSAGNIFSQQTINYKSICNQNKTRFYDVLGRGTLVHIRCENENFFVLLDNKGDDIGHFLNYNYRLVNKKLKVLSVGPEFFVLKISESGGKYIYNFKTKSWKHLKIEDPKWSTGERD